MLFPFQRDLVRWSLNRGRSAIFADCGLGKTFMQLVWAWNIHRNTGGKVIIFAPLSVNVQTIEEGIKLGITVGRYDDLQYKSSIVIANYENIDKLNPNDYNGIVLDESSILKSVDSKTRKRLIEFTRDIKYRLCCTATPSPNDISELANHAEFLGVMKREEMLSKWFYNNGSEWVMKGHAVNNFYKWISTWGMFISYPSDLGYSDDGFSLPELNIKPVFFDYEFKSDDTLFSMGLKGIEDRAKIRKDTVSIKAGKIAEMINESSEQWIVWCGIDLEADTLVKMINGAVNVKGSDSSESKSETMQAFKDGGIKVLITKPKIAGFGMNFQQSHNMVFFGLSDSYEAYYQCIRRQYRFGQKDNVNVYIALAGDEGDIFENVVRKERNAVELTRSVIKQMAGYEISEIRGSEHQQVEYTTESKSGDNYTIHHADSCVKVDELESTSIDLSVYSPPFASLYTYSNSERDLGNCQTDGEFFDHYQFIVRALLDKTKPGRNTCVHCMNIPTKLIKHGYIGITDFRGDLIRLYEKCGWIYYGEVCIWKNPQVQSIRTHTKCLAFHQFNKDSIDSRPGLPDYVLIFKKPGENAEPVVPTKNGLDNDKWIQYASPIWMDVRETFTLNSIKADKDEKHICPLQLDVIERLIHLYSNKGETVLDPFNGVGSTGFVALKNDRKYVGIELKQEYYDQSVKNLENVEREINESKVTLFNY